MMGFGWMRTVGDAPRLGVESVCGFMSGSLWQAGSLADGDPGGKWFVDAGRGSRREARATDFPSGDRGAMALRELRSCAIRRDRRERLARVPAAFVDGLRAEV